MGLSMVSPPASEPLTLTQAKLFLRVDTTDEDDMIAGLISAAREKVELHTDRQLVTATYKFTHRPHANFLWDGHLQLPKPPVQAVTQIQVTDDSGNVTTLDSSTYVVYRERTPCQNEYTTLPTFGWTREDAIIVTFTGYGVAAAVPQGVTTAMYWLIATFYKNREEMDSPINSSIERLLDSYTAWKVGA